MSRSLPFINRNHWVLKSQSILVVAPTFPHFMCQLLLRCINWRQSARCIRNVFLCDSSVFRVQLLPTVVVAIRVRNLERGELRTIITMIIIIIITSGIIIHYDVVCCCAMEQKHSALLRKLRYDENIMAYWLDSVSSRWNWGDHQTTNMIICHKTISKIIIINEKE